MGFCGYCVPEQVGATFQKGTVNGMRFTNWSDAGVFEKIFEIVSMKDEFAELSIDST